MHGEDQQKNIKHGRSHTTPSTAAETKLAWHFTKSHQVVSTQKMLFTHHRKQITKKKKKEATLGTLFPWPRVGALRRSWSQKIRCYKRWHLTECMTQLPQNMFLEGHSWPQMSMRGLRGHALRLATFLLVYRDTHAGTNHPSKNKGKAPWHASGTLATAHTQNHTENTALQLSQ